MVMMMMLGKLMVMMMMVIGRMMAGRMMLGDPMDILTRLRMEQRLRRKVGGSRDRDCGQWVLWRHYLLVLLPLSLFEG